MIGGPPMLVLACRLQRKRCFNIRYLGLAEPRGDLVSRHLLVPVPCELATVFEMELDI